MATAFTQVPAARSQQASARQLTLYLSPRPCRTADQCCPTRYHPYRCASCRQNLETKVERDTGYLKRTTSVRDAQRTIPLLRDEMPATTASNNDDKCMIAGRFYDTLYRPETADPDATSFLLFHVPRTQLNDADERHLLRPFTLKELPNCSLP